MNWITKALSFGEKIKRVLKKRPSKEDIANSDWTSCCKGPILKKDLEEIENFASDVMMLSDNGQIKFKHLPENSKYQDIKEILANEL